MSLGSESLDSKTSTPELKQPRPSVPWVAGGGVLGMFQVSGHHPGPALSHRVFLHRKCGSLFPTPATHPIPCLPELRANCFFMPPGCFPPKFFVSVSMATKKPAALYFLGIQDGVGGVGRWETDEVPFSWDLSTLLLPPPGPPPLPKGPGPALFLRGQAACLDGLLGCGSPGVPRGLSSV